MTALAPTIACVIIAHAKRASLIRERVVPSVLANEFDEVVLVGDAGYREERCRTLLVPDVTATTLDGLFKRDVGTVATRSEIVVYLNDDHALHPAFALDLRDVANEAWDVIVPNRYTYITDHQEDGRRERIDLNNGELHEQWVETEKPMGNPPTIVRIPQRVVLQGYCGGHAGIFRRTVIRARPWAAQQHHRLWDLYSSLDQQAAGFRFLWRPRSGIAIEDLEPERAPWR